MKELSGTATVSVAASAAECLDLLAAVDRYPQWHPEVVKRAEVLQRNPAGEPVRARATVRVALGPLTRDLELAVEVQRSAQAVRLIRMPNEPSDPERFEVRWHAQPEGGRSELAVALLARLEVPRLLPLGGLGETLAQGFADAAKGAIEGSSPNASATSS